MVEGLRKGARYLYSVLEDFVLACVQTSARRAHTLEEAEECRRLCGIGEDTLHEFAELDPRWDGEISHIRAAAFDAQTFPRLEALLAYPWTWRKFSTARFSVMGRGSRSLLQARLLGLDKIVAIGRSAVHASDYWLHHYAGLDESLSSVIVCCALGCRISDGLLAALIDDARVALRVDALAATRKARIALES